MKAEYNHREIEVKWQKKWREAKVFEPDLDKAKQPFYNLMMFPYPSAEGMHVGNMYAFTGSDIYGRYHRMKGYDVLEPIGLDGFGIHSENYAIKIGEHIRDVSRRTEKNFYRQLEATGNSYDWSRRVETFKPDYYRWTQWLFLQMYNRGLAYRKEAPVNWCPSCKTVISNEQVENGRCERCKTEVVKRPLAQWFFRITDYVEKLLQNLETINWAEEVKTIQRNWIGKSMGAEIEFAIDGREGKIRVFTTRADTLFGVTFIVLSPEHELVKKITTVKERPRIDAYLETATQKSDIERKDLLREKTGVFTGAYAINPVNNEKIPIWVADYVTADYGTGAVMAVPGHDDRDHEFAQKYKLPILEVVKVPEGASRQDEGIAINSGLINGLPSKVAAQKVIDRLQEQRVGRAAISYRLRDWCVSRQRYWGPPIPMVKCEKCGWVTVPEKDLPVLLPDLTSMKDVLPDGSGKGPLARQDEFVKTTCPKCGGPAERETDVLDPFVDSCWYYFRYPSVEYNDRPFDSARTKKWLPVNMYIGGREHSVLHLLYTRFVTMVLHDAGMIDFEEPFKMFFAHGLIVRDGAKMSKSKGNIVNPDEFITKFGADAVRLYLMFLGEFKVGGDWRDAGMQGMAKFVRRVWKIQEKMEVDGPGVKDLTMVHRTIKIVGSDIEKLSYNTAIARIMEFVNWYYDHADEFSRAERKIVLSALTKIITPFAPHLAEELWHILGNDTLVSVQPWPEYDPKQVIDAKIEFVIQVNGKIRDKLEVTPDLTEAEAIKLAEQSEKVQKFVVGKEVVKKVFVKDKLINLVVK